MTNNDIHSTEPHSRGTFQSDGYPTVTPRIIVRRAEALVAFVKEVLEATGAINLQQRQSYA